MLKGIINNQHRIETHRALELLSDYYTKLTKTQEKQLIIEIERLIRVFKSRFFQALIDIQEFYEITLLDGKKANDLLSLKKNTSFHVWNINEDTHFSSQFSNTKENVCDDTVKDLEIHCYCFEITILRGKTGLGFSIAGGIDSPHHLNDYRIHVTKIIPGGAAANDGRLQINDIVEKVNEISVSNVTHAAAVNILKQAGDEVKLYIRRKKYSVLINKIELSRETEGFGFSIAGGIGNQHIPGENGIYITKIVEGGAAQIDGQLKVGHKLIAIKNSFGEQNLENVTHEEAVEALKTSQEKIILFTVEPEEFEKKNFNSKNIPDISDKLNAHADCSGITIKHEMQYHQNHSLVTHNKILLNQYQDDVQEIERTVILNKGLHGFGFNIVGGENNEGIFISYILDGGSAAVNGKLCKGDKIKNVNGIDFSNVSHEEAVSILKNAHGEITMTIEQNKEEYSKFEANLNSLKEFQSQQSFNFGNVIRTTQKKSMYLRALFNYNPNKDDDLPSVGLSFHFGDILHVTNAGGDEWWLASKISLDNKQEFGIIPSRNRWERKQRARDRSVKFEGQMTVLQHKQSSVEKKKKNYFFSRKFPFMKNKDDKLDEISAQESFMLCYTQDDSKTSESDSQEILYRVELPYMEELTLVYLEKDNDEDNEQLCIEDKILSYQDVREITINYARPIIILGPIKDKINDDLITEFPGKFESCIPHTTRPKRDNEIDGRDYHFISSREKMEESIQNHLFIEAGQYNENLYGTSIASVKEVANKGKNCVLDVSGNAIKRLYAAQMYPITIFIKPKTIELITNLNQNITIEQAKKHYYRALRIEQEFTEYFTDIIEADSYEKIYEQIKQSIANQSRERIWVPFEYQ